MNVLVFGGGLQGLSCGASLSKKKHTIDALSSDLQIRKSHFFRKVYAVDQVESIEELELLLKEEQYDVIIPMSDKGVSFLCKNKQKIEAQLHTKCACPDNTLLSIVEDKHQFMDFCQHYDIPHPKTRPLTKECLEECAIEIGFPALIKPNYSVGARGITRVESLKELKSCYPVVLDKFGDCTLQELIENEEYYYNVMLYRDKNGCILAYTISKIVRMYPIHAGSSSCLISIENDELLEICKDCLNKLNWVGMADFDVLQSLDTKEYRIIEINPRVPASLRAATISGVVFPEIIIHDALGLSVPSYSYQPGKVLRYLGIDILWFLKSPKRCHTTPSWMKFFEKDVYYQDIYKQDPSTWWTWLAEGLVKIGNRNKKLRQQ